MSPAQSGTLNRPDHLYYTRGSMRGMARGGKGLTQTCRSSGWHRGIYPLLPFLCFHLSCINFAYFCLTDQDWRVVTSSFDLVVISIPFRWFSNVTLIVLFRRLIQPPHSFQRFWPSPLCCQSEYIHWCTRLCM